MGGMGGLRGLGVRAARAENEKAVCFSNFKLVSRCLYFGNGSLILRSSCIVPVSFLYRLYRVSGKRKKFY